MTGKHRNWHSRWTLDPAARAATHETGWAVRFVTETEYADMPPAEIGGLCWAEDGRVWIVLHQGGDAALDAWLAAQAATGLRDRDSIERRIKRLMREAGELWINHIERAALQ